MLKVEPALRHVNPPGDGGQTPYLSAILAASSEGVCCGGGGGLLGVPGGTKRLRRSEAPPGASDVLGGGDGGASSDRAPEDDMVVEAPNSTSLVLSSLPFTRADEMSGMARWGKSSMVTRKKMFLC